MHDEWILPGCPEPGTACDWHALEDLYPPLAALADCQQDSVWHAEGDVLTHTKLVVDALVELPAWQQLSRFDRQIVFTATLLHDIAKPLCSHIDGDGRTIAPNHAPRGARIAHALLYGSQSSPLPPAPLEARRHIAELIRLHSLPQVFLRNSAVHVPCIRASLCVRNAFLALLAEADCRGRRSQDEAERLDTIELYREHCKELDCYTQIYPFANAWSRWCWICNHAQAPSLQPFDDRRCTVTLVCGLPGSGKDSFIADEQEKLSTQAVVSLDRIRAATGIGPEQDQGTVIQLAREELKDHLRAGRDCIWNATNITREMRAKTIRLCVDYRAAVNLHYLDTSWQELCKRNKKRGPDALPMAVLTKLANKLDYPSHAEAMDCHFHTT